MDSTEARFECLKLALEKAPGNEVETARLWADFILGASDAKKSERAQGESLGR